jgi:glucose-1-phosphate adenylyltransferase
VLILSGDHIYKMDYGVMLREHLEKEAAVTIGAIPVRASEATRFGVFAVDCADRVQAFQEKSSSPREIPDRPGWALASMGIYLFETQVLIDVLREDAADPESSHDFGRDVIPRMVADAPVYAHRFVDINGKEEPYWRDIGTLDSYYEANIDLCRVEPKFNLYDMNWQTYTLMYPEPPAKTVFGDPPGQGKRAEVVDSLLCQASIVSGAKVKRSILSNRVRVESGASVDGSILFAGVEVGENCRIQRAIIDKWVSVPPGTEIGFDQEADARRFTVTDSGIVVVPFDYAFDGAGAGTPTHQRATSSY